MKVSRTKPTPEELREQDEEKAGRWLLTYCSLIITLVAVFMMLVSYSSVSRKKVESYHRSIGFTGKPTAAGVRGADQTEQAIAALTSHALMNGYSEKVQIVRLKDGFKVTIPGAMAFGSESVVLQESAYPLLGVMGGILKKGLFSLGIASYTGDVSLAATTPAAQWELSGCRANAVLRYFLSEQRIPGMRLASAGFGPWHPVMAGTSEEARQKNDRLEFIFVLNDGNVG